MKSLAIKRILTRSGIFFLLVLLVLALPDMNPLPQEHGVTFSVPQALGLGLEWKEVYAAMFEELEVKHVRLVAYWDRIEKAPGVFDFTELDYQMDVAGRSGADVVLALGQKVPRWPECHTPDWAKEISQSTRDEYALRMIATVIKRYQDHPALAMWQLENEPFLEFGHCPFFNAALLDQEQALVREIDPGHPILITDSGELNLWLNAARYGDVFGTTMYRTVFSSRTHKPFHYDYLFPSWVYRFKGRYVKGLFGKDVLVSELQGEPWGPKPFVEMTPAEIDTVFSIERFQDIASFYKRTQLPKTFWWGVEYWYWEKEHHNRAEYWNFAKTLF